MTDMTDRTLLHYRLVEKIGEGGMGAVWKAVDTTLNRDVAVKLLPEMFSADADRLARFEREARLLASLNHPNIAGIFGIHEDGGTRFLAMELIDGEDLAQRLSRGAMASDEAMRAGLQIAQALEAAHESGVIHRDLKPANIKVTPGGTVKVLDFGLAKAFAPDASEGGSASMSPTLTTAGTVAGVILGTASYMSPEQAKGKAVDRRADIWSFGVVLFEMLTGRRIFQGETVSETLAAVMMKDVQLGALPGDTPAAVRRLLQRCLQRDPASRLRDIGDARIALEEALRAPQAAEAPPETAPRRSTLATVAPWAVAALSLVALALVWLSAGVAPEPAPVMRLTVAMDDEHPLAPLPLPMMALSPDGTSLAFVGDVAAGTQIFLRPMDQPQAVPLPGTEGGESPFFSPDGESIGFVQDGMLRKVSVRGGPPTTLCEAPRLRGASWGSDGAIVFAPDRASGLLRVSEAGGEPEVLTELDAATSTLSAPSHRWPEVLPGGNTVLFTATANNSSYENAEIVAMSPGGGEQKTLVKGGTFPRYLAAGFLVFARGNTLFAARFDADRVELTGPAVPVLEGVTVNPFYGTAQMVASRNGTLVYLQGPGRSLNEQLIWLDREGNLTPASEHLRIYSQMSMSPDGRRVAVAIPDQDSGDIWILDLERDTFQRLTFHKYLDTNPLWSPDGEWIVFSSMRDEEAINLYRKRANGTGEVERLTIADSRHDAISWSPDGKLLAFESSGGLTDSDILLLRMEPEPTPEAFLQTPFAEFDPMISPDGKWIAYSSNESGAPEVYARPLGGPGGQVKISTSGGIRPRWTPDGKELFYLKFREQKMYAVDVSYAGEDLRPGHPRPLFDYPREYDSRWTFSPDGRRILSTRDEQRPDDTSDEPAVVVNWFRELEAKVPARTP